jgi:hypothetical protein
MAASEMNAEELAELYLRQFDRTYEEHVVSTEPSALLLWEEWICDDPDRAWPVFGAIVARRRDDEVLYQVGHRLRLLLSRHGDAFRPRAEELVRATPRFARVIGEDVFEPDEPVPTEEEFIDAWLTMNRSASDAHSVDDVIRGDARRGLALAVEIVHRGPRHDFGSYETFGPLQRVLDDHGEAVIDEVEAIARESLLVRRCLWRMLPRERNTPPREGEDAEVWRRAIAAHGASTDFVDEDAPLPAPRTLPAQDEVLIEAWFVYQKNFWAFEAVGALVSEEPELAWPFILRLLERAEGQAIFNIAAGPLEDLLTGHGLQLIDRIAEEARQNEKLRTALTGVWLNEGDAVYARYAELMRKLNPEGAE